MAIRFQERRTHDLQGSLGGRSAAPRSGLSGAFGNLAMLLLLAFLAGSASAATLCVGTSAGCDEAFGTPAEAIAAADPGDTVVLRGQTLSSLPLPADTTGVTVDARLNRWASDAWTGVLGSVEDQGEGNTVLALPFVTSTGAVEPPNPVVIGPHTHSATPATCDAHPDAEYDSGTSSCLFLTVQAAIDFSHPGSTVVVPASGAAADPTPRFENLVIFENRFHAPAQLLTGLRLCSSPPTGPPAAPADACSTPDHDALIDGSGTAGHVVDVRAPDVLVKGLTVQHPQAGLASGALRVAASGVRVLENHLRGAATPADALLALTLEGENGLLLHAGASDVLVEGNRIVGWGHSGIYVHPATDGPATIRDNLIQGNARSGVRVANDDAGSAVTIDSNTLGPNGLRGVLVEGGVGTVLRDNAISLDLPWTLDPRSGAGVVLDGAVGARLEDNRFSGALLNAVAFDQSSPALPEPDAVLRGNVFRLAGRNTFAMAFTASVEDRVIDARGNDWGLLTRPAIAAQRLHDEDGSNRVRFVPYLDRAGAYHPPQPVVSCFRVTASPASIQLVPVGTTLDLQDALDLALPGEPTCRAPLGRVIDLRADSESYDGATSATPALIRTAGIGQARLLARSSVAAPQWPAGPGLTFAPGSEDGTVVVPETGVTFVVDSALRGVLVELASGPGVLAENLDPAKDLVSVSGSRFVPLLSVAGPGVLARDGAGIAVIDNDFALVHDPVRFEDAQGGIVRFNVIAVHGTHGIALLGSTGTLVQANTVTLDRSVLGFGTTVDGIRVSGGSGVRVHLNQIRLDSHPGSSGIRVEDGSGHEVLANTLERNAIGVYVKDMAGALVRGNTVQDGLGQGLLVNLLGGNAANPSLGVYVGGGAGVEVRSNTFRNLGDGVRLFQGSGQLLTSNAYRNVGTAVRFLGAQGSTADHEDVRGAGTVAAWAAGGSLQPTGNVFTRSCVRDADLFVHLGLDTAGVTADARLNDWGVYTAGEVAAGTVDQGAGNIVLTSPFLADDCLTALLGPAADFTRTPADPVYAAVDTLAFMDTSVPGSGPITSWTWTFGDGEGSSEQHPTHVYAAPGTYTVTLTVEDDHGLTSTKSATLDLLAWLPPVADFTAVPNPTDRLTPVQFTDASATGTGTIVARTWDFDDGATSTDLHPTHTYADLGTFTVTLTLEDQKGQQATKSLDVVVENLVPVPAGSSDTLLTDRLTAVHFTDASTDADGAVTAWQWSFGDGATSTAQHPTHTYGSLGTFTPMLTVTDNDGGSATTTLPAITVVNLPPSAAGSSDRVLTDRVTAVQFTDASADPDGTLASWLWAFGDGATSTAQDPTHTYATLGTFTPTLTVTDNDGASVTVTLPSITVVNLPPVASFTAGPLPSNRVDPTTFTDGSTDADGGVVSWSWTFGDGGTSTAQNPTHTYATLGAFTVTLTVQDADGGSDSATFVVPVVNLLPEVSFAVNPDYPDILAPVLFDESSADRDGTVVSWRWEFGDGATSTLRDAVHSYRNGGFHQVNLTVTDNDGGAVRITKTIFVCAPGLSADALANLGHVRVEYELCLRFSSILD